MSHHLVKDTEICNTCMYLDEAKYWGRVRWFMLGGSKKDKIYTTLL